MAKAVVEPRIKADRICTMCKELQPWTAFNLYRYRTNQNKMSLRSETRCRACCSKRRKLRTDDPNQKVMARVSNKKNRLRKRTIELRKTWTEVNRDSIRRWKVISEHKRRVLKMAAGSSMATRQEIEEIFNQARVGDLYLDAYTGELIDDPTLDHIVSLASGGLHVADNMCITSFSNNASKNRHSMLSFMLRLRKEADLRG